MAIAKPDQDRCKRLIIAEHVGMMVYFEISPTSAKVTLRGFVNNEANVGVRRVAMNPSVKTIPDQSQDWTILIVGDSVRV